MELRGQSPFGVGGGGGTKARVFQNLNVNFYTVSCALTVQNYVYGKFLNVFLHWGPKIS